MQRLADGIGDVLRPIVVVAGIRTFPRARGAVGPGLAVKWIKLGAAPQPWGFLLIVFAQASLARHSVKSPAAFAAGL